MLFLIQSSLKRLSFLLDVHTFSPTDLTFNQTILTWPAKVPTILQEAERIVEESKTRGEATLREKQEKVVIEIEKVRKNYIQNLILRSYDVIMCWNRFIVM